MGEDVLLPEVKILRLQPGDILVAQVEEHHTMEEVATIRWRLQEHFPDHEVIVTLGVDLQVARNDGQGEAHDGA